MSASSPIVAAEHEPQYADLLGAFESLHTDLLADLLLDPVHRLACLIQKRAVEDAGDDRAAIRLHRLLDMGQYRGSPRSARGLA
jgi:hypothetical protein